MSSYRNRYFRLHLAFYSMLTLSLLLGSLVIWSQRASAAPSAGYFTGSGACYYAYGACQSVPSYGVNDVLPGRDPNTGANNAIPASAYASKAAFANFIISELSSANAQTRIGAAFIMNTMVQAGTAGHLAKDSTPSAAMQANFLSKVNNPYVRMVVASANPLTYSSTTSFYDSAINDDFFDTWNGSTTRPLIFFENSAGAVLYIVEIPCGNPLGGMPGLPDWWLQGTTTASPSAPTAGQTITWTHSVKNMGPGTSSGFSYQAEWATGSTGPGAGAAYSVTKPSVASAGISSGTSVPTSGTYTSTFTIPNGTPNGAKYCQWVTFTNADPYGDRGYSTASCVTVGGGGGGGSGCPSLPNPDVTVALPDKAPTQPSLAGLYTTTPNYISAYNTYQFTPLNKTQVTSIQDISVGGSPVLPTKVSESYQQVVLDYSPYISAYPYDSNQASVTYVSYYNVTPFKSASSPSYYTCPSGGSLSGSTCTITTSYAAALIYISHPPCGANSFQNGPTVCDRGICNAGDTGGGASPTCFHTSTYAGLPWYAYIAQPSYVATSNTSTTVNALLMTACYPRAFQVSGINSSGNTVFNNYEKPSSATAGGFTATVNFSYPPGDPVPGLGLRLPMQANLQYSYAYSPAGVGCSNSGPFAVAGGGGPGSVTAPLPASNPCAVSLPPLMPGDSVCITYSVTPSGDTVDASGNVVDSNGTPMTGTQCSTPVVNEPYFKVFGGDISVGGLFATTTGGATTCPSNGNTPGVYGWNTEADTGTYGLNKEFAGAGAQFGINALGVIQGTASNQYNLNANPYAQPTPSSFGAAAVSDPIGLSFSNLGTSAASGNFGGNSGMATCIPDFFADQPSSGFSTAPPANASAANGNYVLGSSLILGGGTVPPNSHAVIYVKGDIYITGDIKFPGNYGSVDQVPSLVLVAQGNIYISNAVKSLSGIFVAEPTDHAAPTNGYIYDCATGINAPVPSGSLYSTCNTQLTVNGSFIGNQVFLMRVGNATGNRINSSLRGSFPSETNTNTNAAEIFNYGPAIWMNAALPRPTATSAGYDSVVSMPPIF